MKLREAVDLFCKSVVDKKFKAFATNPMDRFFLDAGSGKLKCRICGGMLEGAQNAVNHWTETHKGKSKKKAA